MEPGYGYWLYLNDAADLTVSGDLYSGDIGLSEGWNLVGFNSDVSINTSDAVESISSYLISVWLYYNGLWRIYDPDNPSISDLLIMEPGNGYWINVSEYCVWNLP